MTPEEKMSVLDIFGATGAIKNSDQILMLNTGDNVTTPGKITAELLRAYLNAGFAVTIGMTAIKGWIIQVLCGILRMLPTLRKMEVYTHRRL